MKVVIWAGGMGTRLSEETGLRPKPMVEVGGHPILWHIMKTYAAYGFKDFVICCGYKGHMIKEYFANYFLYNSDLTVSLKNGDTKFHDSKADDWNVTLVDTGLDTMTGGRLKRVAKYLGDEFLLTYGDGVANINISDLVKFHREQGKLVTVSAVKPPGRFGALNFEGNKVVGFSEKIPGDGNYINGGYFVCNSRILDRISDDASVWETDVLEVIAKEGQLCAYKHDDFWQPMDTIREKNILNKLWETNKAPWKIWE